MANIYHVEQKILDIFMLVRITALRFTVYHEKLRGGQLKDAWKIALASNYS